ncbi:MAG: NAD(P)-binding domain-containing protein, partial [Polynucleobacter sp.]|nr:NAD(P)-binding domain-containing protein [Polynucleobacter sp.]
MEIKKIAFIGLGVMGRPMALRLAKAGYELAVYDINPQAFAEFKAYKNCRIA